MSHVSPRTGWHALPWALACLLVPLGAQAQESADQVIHATRNTSVVVPIYKSRIVELPQAVKRISIGNPDIADVLIVQPTELYVLGKDLGNTNVLLWDREEKLVSTIAVSVSHDLESLKAQLARVLPGENIEVTSARRNIVLSGTISSVLRMDAALLIARSYLEQVATAKEKIMFKQENGSATDPDKKAGEVINLLSVSGAQQVMLQVRVAEVQRDAVKHLNAQFNAINNGGRWTAGGVNGGATFPQVNWNPPPPIPSGPTPILGGEGPSGGNPVGPMQSAFAPTVPSIINSGLFGSFLSSEFFATVVLDAFQQRGLAKILAEPTVMTQTGEQAQFLSGGSFPVPVPEQNGVIGIEYKDFGVKLNFVPLILENGRINLKLNISVSELVQANSLVVTPITSSGVFAVPALSERRAISTVELADGQSVGVAGLMNESMRNAVTKFPGLGDIPILGQLFRSQDFQRGQTELLILVTPHLAKPLPAGNVRLPTDNVTEPSNVDFFLRGVMEGQPTKTPQSAPQPQDSSK